MAHNAAVAIAGIMADSRPCRFVTTSVAFDGIDTWRWGIDIDGMNQEKGIASTEVDARTAAVRAAIPILMKWSAR